MPLVSPSTYRPPRWLRGAHLQTILPSLLRRVPIPYRRERIVTPDDDFLDLDWAGAVAVGSGSEQCFAGQRQLLTATANCKLAILSHGLEGDSTRPYLAGMVRHLTTLGFDCLAWHFRSCSGEMNRQARFYHIGETGDLAHVIAHAQSKGYTDISLVGFSAGGNVTLKYLGENGSLHQSENATSVIRRAVAFSVPMDLLTASDRLEAWDSMVYNVRFQRTLKAKVQGKNARLPERFQALDLRSIKTLRQFDDLVTAPLHGFRDVTEYYTVNSSLRFLRDIRVPTLIVNAQNDPFLSPECFPTALSEELEHVWMEFPAQGGHCGFAPAAGLNAQTYWSEERAGAFLMEP